MFDLCPGDQLTELLQSAKKEVIVVAPFIKIDAIRRLLVNVDPKKVEFNCVTRWIVEDIVAGVCDIELFDFVQSLPNGTLWMNMRLHAKYIRADDRIIVGSANVTASALGWRVPSNLELMIDASSNSLELRSWETNLFNSSVVVSKEYRDKLQERASALIKKGMNMQYVDVDTEGGIDESWIPRYSVASSLYSVYSGIDTSENMIESAYRFAVHDLNALGIPANLSEEEFNVSVAKQLSKLQVFREVLDASRNGKENGVDVKGIKAIVMGFNHDRAECDKISECIIAWILHFFRDEYKGEFELVRLIKAKKMKGI